MAHAVNEGSPLKHFPPQHTVQRIACAAILFAALPLASLASEVTATSKEPTIASVTVATTSQTDLVGQVAVSGTLVPQEEILVYPQVNGSTIESLLVDIGDTVRAGETLATLNNSTLTAQLAQSEAELARASASISQARSQILSSQASATQAKTVLDRARTLRQNGSGTQAALDQAIAAEQTASAGVTSAKDGLLVAEAQLGQAQAQLDIAKLNLDRATLRAPAAGLISDRNGQIGAIASSGGEPIFRIIRDGALEVEAEVIETALGSISLGDTARLNIAGAGDALGKVRRISPTVDPRNRLGKIRISLSAVTGLRSGLFASGQVVVDEHSGLAVPTTAVLTDINGTYVLVVGKDALLEERRISTGLIWNGQREVTQGLSLNETVVARAGAFFAEGDKINPVFPAKGPSE